MEHLDPGVRRSDQRRSGHDDPRPARAEVRRALDTEHLHPPFAHGRPWANETEHHSVLDLPFALGGSSRVRRAQPRTPASGPETVRRAEPGVASRIVRSSAAVIRRYPLSNGTDTKTMTPENLVAAHDSPLTSAADKAAIVSELRDRYDDLSQTLTGDLIERIDELIKAGSSFRGVQNSFVEFNGPARAADSQFFLRPPDLRPQQAVGVFHQAYSSAVAVPGQPNLLKISCAENPCIVGGDLYFQATPPYGERLADGSFGKRPPVCHKTPYAVLAAAMRIVLTEVGVQSNVGTPDHPGSGYDDMHYDLAWGNPGNLGPGHATCNSGTAALGKQAPPAAVVNQVRAWAKSKGYIV